jgi:hypothetical protein
VGAPEFPDDPKVVVSDSWWRCVSIRVPPSEVFRAQLRETFSFDDDGRVAELMVRGVDQRALDRFLG